MSIFDTVPFDVLRILYFIFQGLISRVTQSMKPHDLMCFTIDNPHLDYPIQIPLVQVNVLSVSLVLAEIERVLESYEVRHSQ